MQDKKPSIPIFYKKAARGLLIEICAGVEEEGVPYDAVALSENEDTLPFSGVSGVVLPPDGMNAQTLAYAAAAASLLGVGIGVTESEAVMQMKGFPPERPVLTASGDKQSYRRLGQNSARAVKGGTFI